jgi:photosystem II stability/assembly factor-like uncharacterized protein
VKITSAGYSGILLFLVLLGSSVNTPAVEYSMQLPKVSTSMLLDIASAGGRLVAVGERGHILHSGDGGESWTQAEVPTTAMLTRVYFYDDKLGWAVGHDGNVMHSRDGGVHWELQRDGVAEQAQINEQRAGRAVRRVEELREQMATAADEERDALAEALDEAQWVMDNAREILDAPLYAPPLMDVWFATPEQGWASGAYGVLLHTSNGGRNWADWSYKVDNPDELHLNGVSGGPGGQLYLASEWGTVFVSGNSGESWNPVESGYDGSFFGVIANPGTGTVFAYGLLGTVYRSVDGGENWEELSSGVQASLFGAAFSPDGALVLVGQGGTATRTEDDGLSFTALIQPRRQGLYGVAPYGKSGFMVTGQGGSKPLVEGATGGQADE